MKRLISEGYDVSGVYVTDPERWPKVASTVSYAREVGLPVRILRREDLLTPPDELRDAQCLSVGFGFILPKAFLAHVRICLNVHGTLLPKYPGARSLNWLLANGEQDSGVTVHIVDEGVDTGPIVLQRAFRLSNFESSASLLRKTLEFEPDVVVDALRRFEREGLSCAAPQSPLQAARFPDRAPTHSEIDPEKPLAGLFNEIRAADPDRFPAYFYVDGQKVCIRLWRPDKPADEWDLI
ncbi:formyltransferase family protein [Bradyrhizobium sp. CB3481]|uniref:methionyl-tRNA formyltransferase n=1 Tax=Bradyrhizobium sp. CB3481 TaxID=3039158 RepID=UPI0024B22696|nr:formyltransferase family protein [Bradyrhizobium sp. CB3481]WFU18955.1 formyltransferase family protein [Bradyrhizobium sp. CB3481]